MSLCISINHLNLALNLKWNPLPPSVNIHPWHLIFWLSSLYMLIFLQEIWQNLKSEPGKFLKLCLSFYINMNLYLNFLYFLKRYCTVVLDDPVIMSRAAVNDWETLDLCLRFDGPLAEEEAGASWGVWAGLQLIWIWSVWWRGYRPDSHTLRSRSSQVTHTYTHTLRSRSSQGTHTLRSRSSQVTHTHTHCLSLSLTHSHTHTHQEPLITGDTYTPHTPHTHTQEPIITGDTHTHTHTHTHTQERSLQVWHTHTLTQEPLITGDTHTHTHTQVPLITGDIHTHTHSGAAHHRWYTHSHTLSHTHTLTQEPLITGDTHTHTPPRSRSSQVTYTHSLSHTHTHTLRSCSSQVTLTHSGAAHHRWQTHTLSFVKRF